MRVSSASSVPRAEEGQGHEDDHDQRGQHRVDGPGERHRVPGQQQHERPDRRRRAPTPLRELEARPERAGAADRRSPSAARSRGRAAAQVAGRMPGTRMLHRPRRALTKRPEDEGGDAGRRSRGLAPHAAAVRTVRTSASGAPRLACRRDAQGAAWPRAAARQQAHGVRDHGREPAERGADQEGEPGPAQHQATARSSAALGRGRRPPGARRPRVTLSRAPRSSASSISSSARSSGDGRPGAPGAGGRRARRRPARPGRPSLHIRSSAPWLQRRPQRSIQSHPRGAGRRGPA